MGKTSELRKEIAKLLKTVHPRVYFEEADDKAMFPYLVFNLPNSLDDGSTEVFVMDIDGWDEPANGDTAALETLMSNVDDAVHRTTVHVPALSVTFYRENRLNIRDPEKKIRRRKYVYQARTHV